MTPKIENRSYSYQGFNVVTITAVLNIYSADGVTVIASTGLAASYNLMQPDFAAEVARQISTQVSEYLAKLQELEARRLALFPTSADFSSAVNQIFDPIQTAIGG